MAALEGLGQPGGAWLAWPVAAALVVGVGVLVTVDVATGLDVVVGVCVGAGSWPYCWLPLVGAGVLFCARWVERWWRCVPRERCGVELGTDTALVVAVDVDVGDGAEDRVPPAPGVVTALAGPALGFPLPKARPPTASPRPAATAKTTRTGTRGSRRSAARTVGPLVRSAH
jgi:hypothetical protein